MKKITLLIAVLFASFSYSQTTYDWLDTAPDNNWSRGIDGDRWSGGLWDQPDIGNILRFNNNHELNMWNNVSNTPNQYSVHKLIFGDANNNLQNRTISGNDLKFNDWGGNWSRIDNFSQGSHTISLNLICPDNGNFILNPVDGDLTITGNIDTNNKLIEVYGTKNLIINGIISGNGGLVIKQNSTVRLTADNTYSNFTLIEAGILKLQGSLANSDVTVKSGATLEIDGNAITLKSLIVESGGKVTMNKGKSLTVTGNLIVKSGGNVVLNSDSNEYSSLIVHGSYNPNSETGTVTYNRYVNANATSSGNDLISSPLPGQSWASFLGDGANSSNLLDDGNSSPTTYAFAPFNKSVSNYVNYTDDTSATLTKGTGYRAATDSGSNLEFTGNVKNGLVETGISISGTSNEEWNLIGNPYPSFISAYDFLNHNINTNQVLDLLSGAIYGYNGMASDKWEIINLNTVSTNDLLVAPGQGFYIASGVTSGNIQFTTTTPDMRRVDGGDDFIENKTNVNNGNFNTKIRISNSTTSFSTDFYFNDNSTLGIDPGYDAQVFGSSAPDFAIYSHLVEENTGIDIAIQSLPLSAMNDVIVPLGINTDQGVQFTVNIAFSDLPESINVYLEDNVAQSFTLLNSNDFILTPSTNLNGTGRFYLHFTTTTLSNSELESPEIQIISDLEAKTIIINGRLIEQTKLAVYDIHGREVLNSYLDPSLSKHQISVEQLNTGIYIVQLDNVTQHKTQKVIVN